LHLILSHAALFFSHILICKAHSDSKNSPSVSEFHLRLALFPSFMNYVIMKSYSFSTTTIRLIVERARGREKYFDLKFLWEKNCELIVNHHNKCKIITQVILHHLNISPNHSEDDLTCVIEKLNYDDDDIFVLQN
jgi:hypothetical protein